MNRVLSDEEISQHFSEGGDGLKFARAIEAAVLGKVGIEPAKNGWKLVPIQPTLEMVAAGASGCGEDSVTVAQLAWSSMVAAAPAAQQDASAARDTLHTTPLTERKTREICAMTNYRITGYVLTNDDGDKCISDQQAVRWMGGDDFFKMMHTHSITTIAQPASAQADAWPHWTEWGPMPEAGTEADHPPKGAPPHSLAHEAAQHLTRWLDMYSCECEGPGHECGRTQVKECRDRLLADAPKGEPSDEDIEAAVQELGMRWDGDRWVCEDADLHPVIRALLARYTAPVDAAAIRNAALDEVAGIAEQAVMDASLSYDAEKDPYFEGKMDAAESILAAVCALKTDQQEQK